MNTSRRQHTSNNSMRMTSEGVSLRYCLLLAFLCQLLTTRLHNAAAFTPITVRDKQHTHLQAIPFLRKPPPPPPTLAADPAAVIKKQVAELAKNSALLGNLKAMTAKFRMSPAKAKMLLSGVAHAIQWEELFFFAFLGWALVPLLAIPQTLVRDELIRRRRRVRTFARSYSKLIADNVASISRIGFVVYIADIVKILLQAMGFNYPHLKDLPVIVAKSLIGWWIVNRISTLKQYLLAIQTRNTPGDLVGSAELVNQVIDVLLYSVGAYILINSLQSSFTTVSGVIAAWGGAATLVVSLASQGLVTQMFYGLFLSASNKFRKGDVVEFGDGRVAGYVANIGWTDTLVRGGDGVMASVPNRELADKPIRNLSRIQMSSVTQELLFKHTNADRIPQFLQDVKNEIQESCSELITDGSRPFRVFWSGYNKWGLVVTITCHFRIKLLGDPYHENRQSMMMAINRAVKKNKMEFAIVVKREDDV